MKETILLYHVNDEIKVKINEIATSLKIDIRIIEDDEIYETMGYLLKMEGYEKSIPQQVDFDMSQEFVFFAGMSDQQLDILLQLFKMNKKYIKKFINLIITFFCFIKVYNKYVVGRYMHSNV